MNREEEISLEIVESWRKNERRATIKFLAWLFLGCAAIVASILFLSKYMDEHKPVPIVYCTKQTYNGHDYLFLSTGNYGEKGVVHDPDCDCHKSVEKRQAKPQKTEGKRYLIMPTVRETSNGTVTSIAQ